MALKIYNKPDYNCPKNFDTSVRVMRAPFYAALWAKYPHLKKYSYKQILALVKGFNRDVVVEAVLNNRGGVLLHKQLGHIFLGVSKIRNSDEIIDVATSEKLGCEVHHNNYHTDQYIGKIYYTNIHNERRDFLNGEYWGFLPTTEFSRGAKPVLTEENWKKYVVITYPSDIRKMVNEARREKYRARIDAEKHSDYDEFKFDD